MRYRLLGPIEVRVAGRPCALGGARQRAVLAALLLRANQTVSMTQLCEALWDEPPPAAESNVRTYLARLRKRLLDPDDRQPQLVTQVRGYQLTVAPGELDCASFDALAEQGRRAGEDGDPSAAAELLGKALALWRGVPFADVDPGPLLRAERARLEEQYFATVELHARSRIEAGDHERVVGELTQLVAEHPAREGLAALLMLALYRCGRQADALDAFAEARHRLVTELGVEPGSVLRTMQQRILAGDQALEPTEAIVTGTVQACRQLPMDITDFTGRDADLALIHRQIDEAGERAVVISALEGMAGVGKTRLAVHVAHELVRRRRFDEIQLWVDLRGFDPELPPADPARVLGGLLALLGVPAVRIPVDPAERAALYRDRLAGKRALVLLDNAADAAQIRPLLPGSPGCLVLITSRRTLPDLAGARSVRLDVFPAEDAVALLGRIAGEQRIAAEPRSARRVVDLCGRLPIAVTLAAQRLRSRPQWTLEDLAERLAADTDRLKELQGPSRAVRVAFDLSYRQLPETTRRVFRLTGQHPGADMTARSVAALADLPPEDAAEILETLLDEHLLHQDIPGRYRPHDLVRLYARERALADEPAASREAALLRLFNWYLHAAETAARHLDPDRRPVPVNPEDAPRQLPDFRSRTDALNWCEAERANLVAVVNAAAERGEHAIAWQLPCALLTFFYLRKHWDDWTSTHRTALDAATRASSDGGRARALNGLGVAHSDLHQFDEAIACHTTARPLFHEAGDTLGEAWNLNNLGVAYHDVARYDMATGCYRDAIPLFRSAGNPHGESISLNNLGDAHRRLGQLEQALTCLRAALASQRRENDHPAQRFTFWTLGDLHRDLGDDARAIADYRQALAISRDLEDRWVVAKLLDRLADALHDTGRRADAHTCWREAHAIFTELNDPEVETIQHRLDTNPTSADGP